MKKKLFQRLLICLGGKLSGITGLACLPLWLFGQCPSGYSSATINWDYLDYLHNRTGVYSATNPVSGLPFVSSSMWQTQHFAIGTNRLTISTTIPVGGSGSLYGELTTHTGETGAYGTGADLAFVKTGTSASTITFTFASEVQNLQFSVFDVDQEITFAPTATNAGGSAVSITLTKPAGASSAIPLNGNSSATTVSGTAPLANWSTGGGSGTNYTTSSNNGTVNVDIAGPVKTVVLTFSNDGNNNDFWISDITACVADPGFPSNYYASHTQPFTGQPSYFLANPQNLDVYMVNAATGVAEYLFSDPGTGGNKLNSLAYDPVNKWLYYTVDNAAQQPVNKTLKKYDFTTESISTVTTDITSLGIPTFIQGVEFASAAFYNGSLYLGIEECDGTSFGNNAESVIWKIDFDGSGNPVTATQVFATNGDNGSGTVLHDWGDIVVRDGSIISHATSGSASNNQYIHFNMQTGAATTYAGNAESSGQLGQTWNGNVYRVKNNIALYNHDGSIGATTSVTTSSCSSSWSGNAGDGSDPFRPKCDFGDAPASYDPDPLAPAANQQACNNASLRIGTAWDREWNKTSSADASADASDEDGISTVTVMNSDGVPYTHVQSVTVLNNTGADVTLGAWLDYDADGIFEASEGVIVTVPTNAATQQINLNWSNITVPEGTPNSFLRVRITSGTLTVNNATGWYADGETEDYPVISSGPILAGHYLDLQVSITVSKKAQLVLTCFPESSTTGFEVQRSTNRLDWERTAWIPAEPGAGMYRFTDPQPLTGYSWYRIKELRGTGAYHYSSVRQVYLLAAKEEFMISPNPVQQVALIRFTSARPVLARLQIRAVTGDFNRTVSLSFQAGENEIPADLSSLPEGIYVATLETGNRSFSRKIIKVRNR